jgi:hypothetical protein
MASKEFELLKDKLAYFGGYKWLPYVDAVEIAKEKQKLENALKEIIKIYEYGQPDNNGEVMVEVADTCDHMYEVTTKILNNLNEVEKMNNEEMERFRKRINSQKLVPSETLRNNFNFLLDEIEQLQTVNKKHIEVVTDYAIENQQLKDKIKGLERINHEQALKIVELKKLNKQTEDTYQLIEYKLTGEHGNDFGAYSKLEDAKEYGQETADDLEIDVEINKITTEFITILEPTRKDD